MVMASAEQHQHQHQHWISTFDPSSIMQQVVLVPQFYYTMPINRVELHLTVFNCMMQFKINPIDDVDYTEEDFKRFAQSLLRPARFVPSDHNGGKHGYAGLILTKAAYQKLVGDPTAVFVPQPKPKSRTPIYEEGASEASMYNTRLLFEQEYENYYTELACIDTLKHLIISNVPELVLQDLYDDSFGFANVSPFEMMEHLRLNSRVNDAYDVRELLDTFSCTNRIEAKDSFGQISAVGGGWCSRI